MRLTKKTVGWSERRSEGEQRGWKVTWWGETLQSAWGQAELEIIWDTCGQRDVGNSRQEGCTPPPWLHPCLNMKLYSPRCWTSPEQWNAECGCILHPFPSMQSQVTAPLLANTGQHPGPILFHSAAWLLAPFHRLLCAPPPNAASLRTSPLAFFSWSKSGSLSPLNGVFAQTSLPWTLFQISSMESRVWPP